MQVPNRRIQREEDETTVCAYPHSSPQKPQEVRGRDKTPQSDTMHRAE